MIEKVLLIRFIRQIKILFFNLNRNYISVINNQNKRESDKRRIKKVIAISNNTEYLI